MNTHEIVLEDQDNFKSTKFMLPIPSSLHKAYKTVRGDSRTPVMQAGIENSEICQPGSRQCRNNRKDKKDGVRQREHGVRHGSASRKEF